MSTTGYLLREVASYTTEKGNFVWRSYALSDGAFVSSGACSKEVLAHWAERAATSEEIRRVHVTDADRRQATRATTFMCAILPHIPHHVLLAKLRRRGLLPRDSPSTETL